LPLENKLTLQKESAEDLNKTEDAAIYKKAEADSLAKNNKKEALSENPALASAKTSSNIETSKKANLAIPQKKQNKILYFIIDDAGHSIEKLRPFLDFPGDITIAVLPGLAYSKQSAELALKKGKKVILHQPMESIAWNDPGPYPIKTGMQENEIIEILERNINSIPGIIGMNNHMGSAITTDERIIKIILKYLYNKNLFFIDSLTTHDSICKKVAADNGYAIMQRDVFLDNIDEKEAILKSISIGKSIAKKKGYAVMIGHAWSTELANILVQIYPSLIEEGFTIKDTAGFTIGENYFANIRN
jgi:polysaccharide deacetylase 2 family uncharacterized protein YibQ